MNSACLVLVGIDLSWKASEGSVHYSAAATCSLWIRASDGLSFLTSPVSVGSSFSAECSRELTVPFSLTSSFAGEFSFEACLASTSVSFSGDTAFSSGVPSFSKDFCLSVSFSGDFSFESPLASSSSSLTGVPSLDATALVSLAGEASLAGLPSFSGVFSFSSAVSVESVVSSFSSVLASGSLLSISTSPLTAAIYNNRCWLQYSD